MGDTTVPGGTPDREDSEATQRVDASVAKAVDEWFSGKRHWPRADRDRPQGGGR